MHDRRYYLRRYLVAGLAGVLAAVIARHVLGLDTPWVYLSAVIAGLTSGIVRDAVERRRA